MVGIDKPNIEAIPMLMELIDRFNSYDISTLKAKIFEIAEVADDRELEDRTDFSFMKRRASDK